MLPSLCGDSILSTSIMILSVALCLIIAIYKVQSFEEKFNITALYPVNKTNIPKESEEVIHITDANESIEIDKEKANFKSLVNKTKPESTTWKVDAVLTLPKEEIVKDIETKPEGKDKEFKPSQQLGSLYDEDSFVISTGKSIGSFTPVKTTSSLISSNNYFKLDYNHPKGSSNKPYTFENDFKPIKAEHEYDSRPTAEVPVKIPAGSLYKSPDPFRDKPTSGGHGFGLEFNDGKDVEVKKRKNPWQSLLNLVTALLPIGIIVSALTPSIVTLESTDNNYDYGHHFSQRSDNRLPDISERCKRRLLCEIHSEKHYFRQVRARPKQCYNIQCEDQDATNKLLAWLLAYHRKTYKR